MKNWVDDFVQQGCYRADIVKDVSICNLDLRAAVALQRKTPCSDDFIALHSVRFCLIICDSHKLLTSINVDVIFCR